MLAEVKAMMNQYEAEVQATMNQFEESISKLEAELAEAKVDARKAWAAVDSGRDVSMHEVIEVAKVWNNMGWAVQEQAVSLFDGEPIHEQNGNAVEMIEGWLHEVIGAGMAEEEAEDFLEQWAEERMITGEPDGLGFYGEEE